MKKIDSCSWISLFKADLNRRSRKEYKAGFLDVLQSSTLKLILFFRLGSALKKSFFFLKPMYLLIVLLHRHYEHKTGIILPIGTAIGGGLHIMHYSGIVINPRTVIGKNFTIMQCVTIGNVRTGKNAGVPKIGNNVVIANNSSVIGNVEIGDFVMVGACTLVCKNVDSYSTVVGCPARKVNDNGLYNVQSYITNESILENNSK